MSGIVWMLSSYGLLGTATAGTQDGDIAQLGERCLRKAEAEGSNPFISTMTLTRAEILRVFYTTICLGRYDGRRETLG